MSLASRLKSGWGRVDQPKRDLSRVDELPAEDFVDLAFQVMLGRKPDPTGLQDLSARLSGGKKNRNQFVYELSQTAEFKSQKPDINELNEDDFVSLAYQVILGRRASPFEVSHHAAHIRDGKTSRNQLVYTLYNSREFKTNSWDDMDFWMVIHRARLAIACQLPKAERIVDLGGSSEDSPSVALIMYGYPYSFKSFTIVELPREKRHELYAEICGEYHEPIQTPQGPVNYVYTSMSDLSAFEDNSIDLVYAGQSIEHVPTDEALTVVREVRRVLKPGGNFCFDTPNRNVTVLKYPNYIVDDHKYEYTHQEMVAILEGNGFEVRDAKGVALMDQSVREGRFIEKEVLGRDKLYDDIENCFLLYYKARKV